MKRVEVEYNGKRYSTKLGGGTMLNPGEVISVDFPGEGWVKANVVSCELLPDETSKHKPNDDALVIGAVIGFTGGFE